MIIASESPQNPIRVYLASPYSHRDGGKRQERYNRVQDFVFRFNRFLIHNDAFIYSPVVNSGSFHSSYHNELSVQNWRDLECMTLPLYNVVWVLTLDGWERSEGIRRERMLASAHKIDVYHLHKDWEPESWWAEFSLIGQLKGRALDKPDGSWYSRWCQQETDDDDEDN